MRSVALVAGVLLAACGSMLAPGSASPSVPVPASPSASAAPTAALPSSAVRITVNGMAHYQGQVLPLTPTGGSVVIVMEFPFAVDRASLERWLPKAPTTTAWIDDRTVRLTYPETESNLSFKVPDVSAADGSAVIGMFQVNVAFPKTRVIDLFTIAELNAIKTTGVRTAAAAFRVSVAGGLTVSPDGRRAIAFDTIGMPSFPSAPAIIDLATRKTNALAQPPASDGPFAFADWLPNGRLLIVGRRVWIGDGDGGAMRAVADAGTAVDNLPWTAVPSPAGDRVALWAYNTDGHVGVVDLRDGTVKRITGPFRRAAADGRVSLVWSPDGKLIAGSDSDAEAIEAKTRARIVDVATDRTVRTIEGGVFAVLSFPTGELVVVRDSGERGAGARWSGVVLGFDGVEHRRYLGGSWTMSPDTRYVLQSEAGGAGMAGYTLIESATGTSFGFGLQSLFGRWLADGRIAFISY